MGNVGRLLLDDDPHDFGAVADVEMRHRRHQCLAIACLALDEYRLRPRARRHGEAAVHLAAIMDVLQLDRRCQLGIVRHLEQISVRHERAVDEADHVVPVERAEKLRRLAVSEGIAHRRDRHALDLRGLAGNAVQDRQRGRTVDQRRDRTRRRARIICRNAAQKAAQVRVVPGLDLAVGQTGLQEFHRVVALDHDRAVAGQMRCTVVKTVDQRGLGGRQLRLLGMHVHRVHPRLPLR